MKAWRQMVAIAGLDAHSARTSIMQFTVDQPMVMAMVNVNTRVSDVTDETLL